MIINLLFIFYHLCIISKFFFFFISNFLLSLLHPSHPHFPSPLFSNRSINNPFFHKTFSPPSPLSLCPSIAYPILPTIKSHIPHPSCYCTSQFFLYFCTALVQRKRKHKISFHPLVPCYRCFLFYHFYLLLFWLFFTSYQRACLFIHPSCYQSKENCFTDQRISTKSVFLVLSFLIFNVCFSLVFIVRNSIWLTIFHIHIHIRITSHLIPSATLWQHSRIPRN